MKTPKHRRTSGPGGIDKERIQTNMKKLLVLILAITMLISCFGLVSCKKETSEQQSTEPSNEQPADPSQGEEINDTLGIPEDLKYDGVFKILGFNGNAPEFGDAELAEPDGVEQALLKRDVYVENRLGISFEYSSMNGQWGDRHTYSDTVYQSILLDAQAWDLIGCYSWIPANLAMQGVVVDLLQLQYLDFDKAWYSEFMVDACVVNDKAYSISGDVSTNLLYSMQGVLFNVQQAEANGIAEKSLYQMVYDGDWTLENWFTMCEDLGKELGGDGVWDTSDYYPIVSMDTAWFDSFYFSSGLKLVEEDEEGILHVSEDMLSEKVLSVYSMMFDSFNTYHSFSNVAQSRALIEERSIFSINQIVDFRTVLADTDLQIRVLPFPKYESGTSTTYQTLLTFGHAQYCIPSDVRDPDRSAAVLETLGYGSYVYTMPAVFENAMKLRYSSNADVSNMFDYLRKGCTLDTASLYCMPFESVNHPHGMFRVAVINEIGNWTSNYNQNYKSGIEHIVEEMNKFYSK